MKTQVLDHGYVELVESWGSDERIVEAARMSTGKGFRSWQPYYECKFCPTVWEVEKPEKSCERCGCDAWRYMPTGDLGLVKTLSSKKHTSPFEMAGMVIEVKAPIFVFREWHRHRTQSYNELSARYTPMPDEHYLPTVERCMQQSTTNKQAARAAGSSELIASDAELWLDELEALYRRAEAVYQDGLRIGVPKEVARLAVPVARYSRMRASANLHNWLRFLALRLPEDAQLEIRLYAQEVAKLVAELFPRTWELFNADKR